MPTNQDLLTKLTKARIAMLIAQPFFGTLALRLKLVEDATLYPPTAATNGKVLYYHPQWVQDNPHEVVMSMLAHEVGHCVFDHMSRRNGRDPLRWNFANDYVVNDMLKDAGMVVPDNWLYDPKYHGMSSDHIYTLLPEQKGHGRKPGQDQFDDHPDAPGTSAEREAEADDWKVATINAANAAKAAGKLTGGLRRFIDEIIHGKADWRAVLRRFATEILKEDYSYQRVNRKFASLGIYLPGLYSEGMGEMVAAIDCSGSIDDRMLQLFGGEIKSIKDQIRPSKLTNIYCHAAISHVDEFEMYDEPVFEIKETGGTSFIPPFEWLEERGIEPKCMVYLTDGYGDFPDEPPAYPVLWLMTTDVVPPWGEVVRIEE